MGEISNSFFYKHCQKILSRMTDEEIINAKNLASNEDRIKNLYKFCVAIDLPYDFQQKDLKAAEKLKELGNDFFKKKLNYKAVECYNQGIVVCPQNNPEGKKLLSILIANRSATFFDLKRYQKVLYDVEYLLQLKSYPKELLHKIYLRQGKCHEELCNFNEAIESYTNLLKAYNEAKLNDKEKTEKIANTEQLIKQLSNNKNNKPNACKNQQKLKEKTYDLIEIKQTEEMGRYAVANRDITIGTTVLKDEPFASCVTSEYLLKNCQHCLKSTKVFIACEFCNAVIFCSKKCQNDAEKYHRIECGILQFLATSGVSINCLLGLRMISVNTLEEIKNFNLNFKLKNKFDNSDYSAVMSLCQHIDKRPSGLFVNYACMAIFLLRLLKQTSFFNCKTSDSILSSDELFIGTRLLDHLLLLQYNAHEVSELTFTAVNTQNSKNQTETVGGAIYVNLAFFNHSCEPSLIRYNEGRKMIVKAIKPIQKGEAIYENYGPMYTRDEKSSRLDFLMSRYCFTCACIPCTQNWPLLESMNPNTFKIRCLNELCRAEVVLHKDTSNMKCPKCETPNSFMNTLMSLMQMTKITKEGEDYFEAKKYQDAFESFTRALYNCYQNIIPPHPDIVQLQQRLRECLVNLGNKRDEPPFDLYAPTY